MEKNSLKHKKINTLIPKLLEQSNKYTKVFKDKKRINNIFMEFENKSSHHFNIFIKESINRYKNMKLGNDLDKIMANSEKRRTTEVNRVLTDNFFTNEVIKQEKNNSKYYTSDKVYKNLKKAFTLIKDSSTEKSNLYQKEIKNKKMEKKSKTIIEDKETKPDEIKTKELLLRGKEDINNIFTKEKSKIKLMFEKYRDDVNILQQIGEKSQEKYAAMHKKIELSLPKLEMINYVHYEPPKYIEKDVEILQKKTLENIIPFTKNKNTNKSNNKTNDLKLKKIFQKLILNNKLIHPKITTISNNRKLNKKYLNDTNGVVYNTAYKELSASKFLDEKRKKLTEILGYDFPKIQNYKDIIKNKYKDIKKKRNKINKENIKNQKLISMTYYDKMNLKIDNEIYLLTQVEKNLFDKPIEAK